MRDFGYDVYYNKEMCVCHSDCRLFHRVKKARTQQANIIAAYFDFNRIKYIYICVYFELYRNLCY